MITLKSHFVSTTDEINFIPIIHDIRFCIHHSEIPDGLVTISIPQNGASLLLSDLKPEELVQTKEKFQNLEGINRSLSLPFQKKELVLDPKQMMYLIDFTNTGKRREFHVQVLGEAPQPPQPPGRRRA